MTFRELFKDQNGYDVIVANRDRNVYPCPSKFGYEAKNPTICRRMLDCKSCWEREVPQKDVLQAYVICPNCGKVMKRDDATLTSNPPQDRYVCQNCGKVRFVLPGAQKAADAVTHSEVSDNVSHPKHYTAGKIECIDCIESIIAPIKEPEQAFLAGQIIKYVARYTLKNGAEDLQKAKWYLDRLIEKVEAQKGAERGD